MNITPSGDRTEAEQAVRGRHETVNRRFKHWGVLHRVFRHDVQRHQTCFGAVATVTQLSITHGEPLFGVHCDTTANT